MGNRGVLGLERLSREQQRSSGAAAREKKETTERRNSRKEKPGEHAAGDRSTKIAGVDPTRARGRFRGVISPRAGTRLYMGQGQAEAPRVLRGSGGGRLSDKAAVNSAVGACALPGGLRRRRRFARLATLTRGGCGEDVRGRKAERRAGSDERRTRARRAPGSARRGVVPGGLALAIAGPRADAGGPGARRSRSTCHVGAAGCHRGNIALGVRVRVWRVGVRGRVGDKLRQVGSGSHSPTLDPSTLHGTSVDPDWIDTRGHPVGTTGRHPRRPHPAARTSSRSPAFIVGVVTAEVATNFPGELAAASRELGAEPGRAVGADGCRGCRQRRCRRG